MLLLVEAAAGLESLHQDSHLLQLSEGQVGDDAQQALQDAGVGAHKGGVDLVQQHHQLVLIARQQQVTLGGGGRRRLGLSGTSFVRLFITIRTT